MPDPRRAEVDTLQVAPNIGNSVDSRAETVFTTDMTTHEPHKYVAEGGNNRWRTCAVCGRGANAQVHKVEERPCGCLYQSIDVPDDQAIGQGWRCFRACAEHWPKMGNQMIGHLDPTFMAARCAVCGGLNPGDQSHARCM